MLSKANIKYIRLLQQKKYRQKNRVFIAEGEKIVQEIFTQEQFNIHSIYATAEWEQQNINSLKAHRAQFNLVTTQELGKISQLQKANQVLMLLEYSSAALPTTQELENQWCLVLDQIRDPGNMGTIIRIADWFGIEHIFCSQDCVDAYNPKVVQSTMGSFLRTKVHYIDLQELFEKHKNLPKYGAVLDGQNAFQSNYESAGFLVIGNESRGVSDTIKGMLTHHITIPKYGHAESLNAAIATGILCAAIKK
ncbi:MAG: RNA methyltransferase [Aureispira sp.]|nr:RNA methyltransferase [Aureispira sp.]